MEDIIDNFVTDYDWMIQMRTLHCIGKVGEDLVPKPRDFLEKWKDLIQLLIRYCPEKDTSLFNDAELMTLFKIVIQIISKIIRK